MKVSFIHNYLKKSIQNFAYDAVSDLVVKPFPRRSEIQDQYILVLRVGDDYYDGPE